MKKYYLTSYKKEKWLLTKKEIFEILDFYFRGHSYYFESYNQRILGSTILYGDSGKGIGSIKTDEYRVVSKFRGSFFPMEDVLFHYVGEKKYIYASHYFSIKSDRNEGIDVAKFIKEYRQSRGIKEYRPKKATFYYGTKGEKYNYFSTYHRSVYGSGFKKEYSNNFYAEEEGVKIRNKRRQTVKDKFIFDYDYYETPMRCLEKSWKKKKVKKQYMKNKKSH